ncbi:hypothetical protein FBQ80_13465 [Candidatus Brocadia sp. AMX2]|nr:hypothetical protein [Candidatus Brocadia sp. AMX2]
MIPIEKVIKGCCKYYGKKEEELLRKGKGKRERQAAIYVSKIMSNAKNTEIGRYFERNRSIKKNNSLLNNEGLTP